jgi:glutamate-1-semialdehyde aminotransferase
MEPVLWNSGCILPRDGYLGAVRELCARHGILLMFDEVITGFRLSLGGAQQFYAVTPDLATFGKAVGGGAPLSGVGFPGICARDADRAFSQRWRGTRARQRDGRAVDGRLSVARTLSPKKINNLGFLSFGDVKRR